MGAQNISNQITEYIEKDRATLVLTTGLLLLFDCFFNVLFRTDILTAFIWFIFVLAIVLSDLKFFFKYIFYFFQYTLNIVAVYIIENRSFFLSELGCGTSRANSLCLITIVHWVLLSVLFLIDPILERKMIDINKSCFRKGNSDAGHSGFWFLVSLIVTLGSLYMLFKVSKMPASVLGLDRFVFEHDYISGAWSFLHTYTIWFIPVLVIMAYRGNVIYAALSTSLFCIYMALAGHKFGIFLSVLLIFMPFIVERFNLYKLDFRNIWRVLLLSVFGAGGLLLIVYRFRQKTYGKGKNEFSEYLYSRLAQQGQMWWAVYKKETGKSTHIPEAFHSMGSFFKLDPQVLKSRNYGIYKMMKLVTPGDIYERKINNYSRYAFSTEASLYYYFKAAGLIIMIAVLAIALAYITNWYWSTIVYGDYFGGIVSGRFYLVFCSVLMQTDFNALFSRRMLLLVIIYICYRMMPDIQFGNSDLGNARHINKYKQRRYFE